MSKTFWKRVGSLWKGKDGSKAIMSGTIDLGIGGQVKVCIFPNSNKDKPNDPDFTMSMITLTSSPGQEVQNDSNSETPPY